MELEQPITSYSPSHLLPSIFSLKLDLFLQVGYFTLALLLLLPLSTE